MPRYEFNQGDTWPPLQTVLEDENGPVPLVGAEVTLLMKQVDGDTVVSGPAEVIDENDLNADPNVQYPWRLDGTDTAIPGIYRAWFTVVFGAGSPNEGQETFPSDEPIDVIINPVG